MSFRIYGIWLVTAVAIVSGCTKGFDNTPDVGCLTLHIMSSATNPDNENIINTLDLFFYESGANADSDAAKIHKHFDAVDAGEVKITLSELSSLLGQTGEVDFLLYAVANCKEVERSGTPTIGALNALTTQADAEYKEHDETTHRAFRSPVPPEDFVMTNFVGQTTLPTITITSDNKNPEATILFKRIAAKIRVAISVVESVEQDGKEWIPDLSDMRLYINNGVRTARLDGSTEGLTLSEVKNTDNTATDYVRSDYYHIMTADYGMSRKLSEHDSNLLTGKSDNTYVYYNDVPLYTYPNTWSTSMFEEHRTSLTVVVPWAGENGEYQPTYYSINVNKGTELTSNSYYYIRLHVGIKGSEAPDNPLELESECEVAEWGKADETEVALRPMRILQLNRTDYVMNNIETINIPFVSTHPVTAVDFEGIFYSYNETHYGPYHFDDKTMYNGDVAENTIKDVLYSYSIDPQTNTLNFTHHFYEARFALNGNSNDINRSKNYTETRPAGDGTTYFYKNRINNGEQRLYCKFDVYLTVRQDTGQAELDSAYQERIHISIYPPIYISSIINTGDSGEAGWGYGERGYVYVNGQDNVKENLMGVKGQAEAVKKQMIIVTVSQLSAAEQHDYEIGDPRTYYINNDLSDESMSSDEADKLTPWTDTNPNEGYWDKPAVTAPTIWRYRNGRDVYWDNAGDREERTIKYYYPTSPVGTEKMLSPQFMLASEYANTDVRQYPSSARRRCASYQEYGFPAGRWRLPTAAEVAYVKELCGVGNDLLPHLLDYDYLNAQSSQKTTGFVRCVYDLWYWKQVDEQDGEYTYDRIPLESPYDDTPESKSNYKTFMWGDRPKDNSQAEALINAYKCGNLH